MRSVTSASVPSISKMTISSAKSCSYFLCPGFVTSSRFLQHRMIVKQITVGAGVTSVFAFSCMFSNRYFANTKCTLMTKRTPSGKNNTPPVGYRGGVIFCFVVIDVQVILQIADYPSRKIYISLYNAFCYLFSVSQQCLDHLLRPSLRINA